MNQVLETMRGSSGSACTRLDGNRGARINFRATSLFRALIFLVLYLSFRRSFSRVCSANLTFSNLRTRNYEAYRRTKTLSAQGRKRWAFRKIKRQEIECKSTGTT